MITFEIQGCHEVFLKMDVMHFGHCIARGILNEFLFRMIIVG